MTTLRVLLIGEGAAGVQCLHTLAVSAHEVVAVVTGQDGVMTGATVRGMASRLGYRVWPAAQARENAFADVLRRERVDLLLNVDGLYILPQAVVSVPRIGSFNLHPGPLPRYAGLNAPCWAIYHGEHTHGVTLHWMDAGIHTGALAYADKFPVEEDETGLTLTGKCIRAGLPLLRDLLTDAGRQNIPRQPQPRTLRRYHGREVPHEGRLLWSEPAARIVRYVRACDFLPFHSPWCPPRAYLAGRQIGILKVSLTGEPSDAAPGTVGRRLGSEILVSAQDEWVKVELVRAGSAIIAAAEALRPGERFALPTPAEGLPANR